MQKRYFLSKSKVMACRQCPKRLYLSVHRKDLELPDSGQAIDFGNQIGDLARALHPGGVLIAADNDLGVALEETTRLISSRNARPLFEATFQHEGVLVRADILLPGDKQTYRMIEVKAASSVKDYYLEDVAIQAWVAEGSGVPLSRVSVMHVNTGFIYPGNGQYDGMLSEVDVTEDIRALSTEIPNWVATCQEVLSASEPEIETGSQCYSPYPCPYLEHCTTGQPQYPVTLLPNRSGKKLARELMAEGYTDLTEVPAEKIDDPMLLKIWRATTSGEREFNLEGARTEMGHHLFPRYYLDFETTQFAIPIWTGTRPYQQLPFQWSCHIEHADGKIEHEAFLDISGSDPRQAFAESLIQACQQAGPIFVYNIAFERSRILELAEIYPDLSKSLNKICQRLVDLLPIAKKHYYHPDMQGSWSIKAVLPTISPELDYSHLAEVSDGEMAQLAYQEAIHPDTPSERKALLQQSLLDYCQLDTLAMVKISHFFSGEFRKA